jgi:hypothetical protein
MNLLTPSPQLTNWTATGRDSQTILMWKLIPVKVEGSETMEPPSYEGDAARQSEHDDDFGTIVTEVTTVTTRRRYRVENT